MAKQSVSLGDRGIKELVVICFILLTITHFLAAREGHLFYDSRPMEANLIRQLSQGNVSRSSPEPWAGPR